MAVVESRLNAGSKAFESLRSSIEDLHDRTAPKEPPSPVRYIAMTLTVVTMALGAAWTLSSLIGERPTKVEMDRVIQEHRLDDGHPGLQSGLNELKNEQTRQGTKLEEFKQQTLNDLSEIKEAVAPKRRR